MGRSIQDIPNERSLHVVPVPRVGGIGVIAGVLLAWALVYEALNWWLLAPLLLLFAVSLLDDIRGLPVSQRFLAHAVAAAIFVAGAGGGGQSTLFTFLAFFSVIWMTNLYNFMDGSDGLAGGMALCGFGVYGVAAYLSGNDVLAMMCFSVAAAALGFLYFNYYPAQIFMGDAGSIPLGFLAAAIGLRGWQDGIWGWWFPLLVFSPFIVDASVTLIKRSLSGTRITEAHREHYYQRAVQLGWSHRKVALFEYALMFVAGIVALLANMQSSPLRAFLILGSIYLVLMIVLDCRWNGNNKKADS